MARDERSRFWDLLCSFHDAVYGLFVIGFVLLSLTLLSLANLHVVPPAAEVIVYFNLGLITTLLIGSGYVLYRCNTM